MRTSKKRWPKGTWMRLRSGQLLRELMNTKGTSNADLGMAAGCHRSFIGQLTSEHRKSCTPKIAENIARRLEVPLELLFEPKASATSGRNGKVA